MNSLINYQRKESRKVVKFRKTSLLLFYFLIFCMILVPLINLLNNRNFNTQIRTNWLDNQNNLIRLQQGDMPSNASNYKYYKTITIDHTMVNGMGSHENFPVLISILDSDLQDEVQSEYGDDIAFAIGLEWLDHEIEHFNRDYSGTEAQLIAWVRIPSLSTSVDTNITMFFGNSTMGPCENPSGVWDSNYKGVWHLKENPGPGGSGDIKDSTSNSNDGTANSMESNDQIPGQIDGSIDFEGGGSHEYIDCGSASSLDITQDLTVEFWINIDSNVSADTWPTIVGKGNENEDGWRVYQDQNSHELEFGYRRAGGGSYWILGLFDLALDTWHHVVVSYNYSGTIANMYLDGDNEVCTEEVDVYEITSNTENLYIADYVYNGEFNGILDEVRVSDTARSADWITTEYNNQYDPDSFYTIGDLIQTTDTKAPTYSDLIESADPLEVYYTEIISINVTDPSGINQVLIEFEGESNDSMTNIGGDTWQYNWTSTNTGLYPYTIWMEDIYNNWNSTSDTINVTSDVTAPTYSDLNKSADPLEVYFTEIISINVSDPAGINQVLIEFEGESNESMTNIGGDTWQYNWTPTNTGLYPYTIWMEDIYYNWNSTSDTINVTSDITAPTYSDLIESADILQLGQNETITISVYDSPGAGVNTTILEYELMNHTMNFMGGNTWRWSNWKPKSDGLYNYTIYMQDLKGNWNITTGNITVVSTNAPIIENVTAIPNPLELGNNITIKADIYDNETSVSVVKIELDGKNYTMTNFTINTYEFNWTKYSIGLVKYTIYANDTENNWNYYTDSFFINDTTKPTFIILTESQNPLEFGDTEMIVINITDFGGVSQALIEFEGSNRLMTNIGGDLWQYNWTPTSTGMYPYIILAKDNNNNWNNTVGSILVRDTIAPTYSDLTESADPVELGTKLTITINVNDLAEINQLKIEFEGVNHTMSNIGGYTWQHDTWMPTVIGNYTYTIWMEDENNNWNSTSDWIIFQDTIAPTYSNLIESADPLELGDKLIITIFTSDFAGINKALIEFEGMNHSMSNIGGNTWQHDTWMPTVIGNYAYTIYIEDNHNNWNSTNNWIIFQDTTAPTYSNLMESADPLEFGDTLVLTISVSDFAGIDEVFIEFEGMNHSMSNIGGNTWQYSSWNPINKVNNHYKIFIKDNSGIWNDTGGWVFVQDTTSPSQPEFTIAPSGKVSGRLKFDWKDGEDKSGIDYYRLIISTNADPNNTAAYILDINTTNTYYELTERLSAREYFYFLCQVDSEGFISDYSIGTFIMISQPNYLMIILIIISAAVVGSVAVILVIKRRSKALLLPSRKKIPFKKILSHIEKISSSQQMIGKEKSKKKVEVEEIKNIPLKLESMDNLELEQKLDEIHTLGVELFDEGAYFEALKQFELAEKILQKLDKQAEAQIFSELITEINRNVEAREKTMEILEQEKSSDDFMRLFNIYYEIIEISKKLNDFSTVDMYQSELIELLYEKKINPLELEHKRSIFEENANLLYTKKEYEKASKCYGQCERVSHFLLRLGKEEELENMNKFKKKKTECLKKISN